MSQKSGNGRPPTEHQFKKGQSGNAKGRPKKPKSAVPETAISKIAATIIQVHKNGKVHDLTAEELLSRSIFNAALSGDKTAQRTVLSWIIKRAAYQEKRRSKHQDLGVKIHIEAVDPRNADAALKLLNIISVNEAVSDPDSGFVQYSLEPDAVQDALRRRRGGKKLSGAAVAWFVAYTKDGAAVKLPRGYSHE